MRVLALFALCVVAVAAVPRASRLSGGSLVNIDKYTSSASILHTWDGIHMTFSCASNIINSRSIITAGHCMYYINPHECRVRVGSSFANSGGQVLPVGSIILYPTFNDADFHNDLSIVRTSMPIQYGTYVSATPIAGSLYTLGDNQAVWATGWSTAESISNDRQISDTQIWTVNQDICKSRYEDFDAEVTDDVLCTGWPDQDNRGQCSGVFGAGVFHAGTLVAITTNCFDSLPTINIRTSSHVSWIQSNA